MSGSKLAKKVLIGCCLCLVLILISFIIYFRGSYPLHYKYLIKKYSNIYGLPMSVVASIINVESGFRTECVSIAGAKGLMQIMDSTGDEIAEKLGETNMNLFHAETNIKYGCFYLRYLLNYYENNLLFALCAYNAGMSNVNSWIEQNPNFEVNDIPFLETKNYVNKIKSSKIIYEKFYGFK